VANRSANGAQEIQREGWEGEGVTVCVLVMLDLCFVSMKYVFVTVKLVCVCVKLLKNLKIQVKRVFL
jgi:hypothetical protein